MNARNDELAAVIAKHYGVNELGKCEDTELVDNIRALVSKINAAGLGPSSVKGLVNTEGIRVILGLGSIGATRVTIARDKAFPQAVVTDKLWSSSEVKKYSSAREKARVGAPGRPPISSRLHAEDE